MKKVGILVPLLFLLLVCDASAEYKIYPSRCNYHHPSTLNFEEDDDNSSSENSFSEYFSINHIALSQQIFSLDYDWEFYWDKTPEQVTKLLSQRKMPDSIIKVPSFWNETASLITQAPQEYGMATYRIVIHDLNPNQTYALIQSESPATSSAYYVNGKLIFQCGDPYKESSKKSHSIHRPVYASFTPNSNGDAEIVIFVRNYFYRIGGLWSSVKFGEEKPVYTYYNILTGFYLFSFGILLFIGILNLIQFFLNIKQKQYHYLFLISLACAARVSVAGFNSLGLLFPNLPAELKVKIEYIAIWLVPVAYYQMLIFLYPNSIKKIFKKIPAELFRHSYIFFTTILGITSLLVPARISSKMVPLLEISTGIGAVLGLIYLITNMVQKKKYIFFHLISVLILLVGFFTDLFFSQNKDRLEISYVPICLAFLGCVQLLMLSKIQNNLYRESEDLTNDLQNTNLSYIRFVPLEFLSLLKKDSITHINLGDHTTVEMSILYSKISVFDVKNTSIPDSDIQYEIYCEYLKKISPYISRKNGFISKFLSGGIMALFPGIDTADNALYAALKMVECLRDMNDKYKNQGLKIDVFTGVHYGNMILGTIGDEYRLDDTVISDTVNSVSRIEAICERLNKNVIISEDLLQLTAPSTIDELKINQLHPIPIKGKAKSLKLFECESLKEIYEQPIIERLEEFDDFEELDELEEV